MKMQSWLRNLLVVLGLGPTAALAQVPMFNATCPGEISVHADQGGPVYINGKHAKLRKFNNSFYEAVAGSTTVSISLTEDGTVDLSYTAKGGANGICTLEVRHNLVEEACPVDVTEADRANYPACN